MFPVLSGILAIVLYNMVCCFVLLWKHYKALAFDYVVCIYFQYKERIFLYECPPPHFCSRAQQKVCLSPQGSWWEQSGQNSLKPIPPLFPTGLFLC